MTTAQFVEFFRASSPYIHSLRGRTVVILLTDQALMGDIDMLIADIALLSSLGVRLVLVQGGRAQIDQRLGHTAASFQRGVRITDEQILTHAIEAAGSTRLAIEAAFSRSLINSPMFNSEARVISGNFVYGRPIGVLDGVDHRFAGKVRQIQTEAIREQLVAGHIVLLSHIGVSITGELFNIEAGEVAVATAQALQADKLLIIGDAQRCDPGFGRELTAQQARQRLQDTAPEQPGWQTLQTLCRACDAGIPRVQVVASEIDGGLLAELYTRDGVGTLVSQDNYDQLRPAQLADIGGILALLAPLEAQGVLVKRSRERLENEIGEFVVFERDGLVIGCAALHHFGDSSELACLVIHPNYRGQQRAQRLLDAVEQQARQQGSQVLFVLTTQTLHWFVERGFEPAELADLPGERAVRVDRQRNAKVLRKSL